MEVTEGQFHTNSLGSLRETRWDGNSESTWRWLLWLLAVLQQFFRWMSVPNHNYLISVIFPLWGCELLNWIAGSSIRTWNPIVVFEPRGLQSGNCWHAHIEYESSKITVFWEIIMSIFTSALRPAVGVTLWWWGQQWLASDSHRKSKVKSKWIFASATMLLLPVQIALLLNRHPIRYCFDTVNLEGTKCQTRLGHLVSLNLENRRQEMRYLAYGQSDQDTEPLCDISRLVLQKVKEWSNNFTAEIMKSMKSSAV